MRSWEACSTIWLIEPSEYVPGGYGITDTGGEQRQWDSLDRLRVVLLSARWVLWYRGTPSENEHRKVPLA